MTYIKQFDVLLNNKGYKISGKEQSYKITTGGSSLFELLNESDTPVAKVISTGGNAEFFLTGTGGGEATFSQDPSKGYILTRNQAGADPIHWQWSYDSVNHTFQLTDVGGGGAGLIASVHTHNLQDQLFMKVSINSFQEDFVNECIFIGLCLICQLSQNGKELTDWLEAENLF